MSMESRLTNLVGHLTWLILAGRNMLLGRFLS